MNEEEGRTAVERASDELSNWGRWGNDDQIGTLNFVTPEKIARAAALARTGKVFGMGIPLDSDGPQSGIFNSRWNPIHTMLATGTDALAGVMDASGVRYADDAINMPVQGATHWDAIGHVFHGDFMYNGYSAKNVDSGGVHKLGIEHARDRMIGRGVLLDVARHKGLPWLDDGYPVTNDDLDATAAAQRVEIGEGDFVIVRTGHLERCLSEGEWGGFAGGDAPGVSFENAYWCHGKSIAAICADTWGVEVRPSESGLNQPWHTVVIPALGLTMGEIFYLKDLADDCADDGVYEFLFAGPPLVITGGTGSPINPLAIK